MQSDHRHFWANWKPAYKTVKMLKIILSQSLTSCTKTKGDDSSTNTVNHVEFKGKNDSACIDQEISST